RRRHTRSYGDWSSDVCSSDLETLFATNAESPAAFTELSLPAMTIGKLVTDTDPASPNELLLTVEGSSQPSPWTLEPNIFSEAGRSEERRVGKECMYMW